MKGFQNRSPIRQQKEQHTSCVGLIIFACCQKTHWICRSKIKIFFNIHDNYFLYDEKQYALVGQSTKNLYQLGDHVLIKVKNTDLERKHLDFNLLEKIEKDLT